MLSGVESRAARAAATLIALLSAALAGIAIADATPTVPTTTAAPANPTSTSGQPTRPEILAAVEKLRADTNLGVSVKKRVLRLNKSDEDQPKPTDTKLPAWLHWIADAFEWIASTARILVWVVAILLAGILGLFIKRLVEARGESSRPLAFSMPTHVQNLDIRPESLPDNIGGAALELWERGEHRAALALLYRGLLSRLAHVHGVPIRDSSTEGDCLALATAQLPTERSAYTTQLIRLWQRAVYGNVDPSMEEFRAMSMGFAAAVESAA